ncbi:MAG: preprotein translocase subunit SecG [Lentisphaerae bacterium]|nr:preprotein translocase subunit SecG [Lentisphaerota bacterium]
MNILVSVLTVADVIIALLLICLILVQQSKDSGFGSAFGGLGESVFGAQTGGHLARLTVVFASLFLILTLSLAIITGHRKAPKSIVELEAAKKEAKASVPAQNDAPVAQVDKIAEPITDKSKPDNAVPAAK